MSAGVIGVILCLVLGGAAGYALGVSVGMEVFKRILIRELDKLDDEDALSVAVIKEIIRPEEDGGSGI
jgi:hypothetical protein